MNGEDDRQLRFGTHNDKMNKGLCLVVFIVTASSVEASPMARIECSQSELMVFSQMYEQCHQRAINRMIQDIEGIKQDNQHESSLQIQSQTMFCSALHKLIDDCTTILGRCYSEMEVEHTKNEQKVLLHKSMSQMFAEKAITLDINQCNVSSTVAPSSTTSASPTWTTSTKSTTEKTSTTSTSMTPTKSSPATASPLSSTSSSLRITSLTVLSLTLSCSFILP